MTACISFIHFYMARPIILMRFVVCMIGSVDDLDFRFKTGPSWPNPERYSYRDFKIYDVIFLFINILGSSYSFISNSLLIT